MVYICSPLRGDVEANIKRATRYCEYAADCGVLPIAPHVAWNGIFDDTIPERRETALRLGIELLRRCDELWVMGDEITQGMQGEIDEAQRLRMAAMYILDEAVNQHMMPRQDQPPLSAEDCIKGSFENHDFTGRILVLNPDSIYDEYRLADNSLWYATHGPGCAPGKNDRTVHARSLFTGETISPGRCSFHGVVKPRSLLAWLQAHPVRNQDIVDYLLYAEPETVDMDGDLER